MQKHLLFMVHGMGTFPAKWEEPIVQTLMGCYDQFPNLKMVPFGDRFEVVPIEYNSIFHREVKAWADNATIISKLAGQLNAGTVETLTKWMNGAGDLTDKNFAWTHATDVLLYRLASTIREAVCTYAGKQITDKITARSVAGPVTWSVIAHSLGAAVTHDTLHRLANVGKAFDPINSKAKVLTTVCNVSRLLQTEVKALESKVQPGFPGQPARVCEYFFTMRHQLDPFGIPQPFDPQNWPDAATISAGRYLRCMPKHIHQLNVHDINHYLVNPEVHVPLFRLLTTQAAISDDEFENAKNRFPPFGKLGDETAIAIRKRLENRAPKLADEWPKIGAIWRNLFS